MSTPIVIENLRHAVSSVGRDTARETEGPGFKP